jgi:hypothetical protein
MDLIFDEDADEVGADIEAYCPKCRADTTHVVITKYEDEIRRVQCSPCGDVHSYRKPRGETEEDVPEPLAAKRRQQLKKPTYEEYMAQVKTEQARAYSFHETYSDGDIVRHPKFGLGFVSELLSDGKLEVTFADGRRILVHNRKDLPDRLLETARARAGDRPAAASKGKRPERPRSAAKVRPQNRRRAAGSAARASAKPPRSTAKRPPKAKASRRPPKPARPTRPAALPRRGKAKSKKSR